MDALKSSKMFALGRFLNDKRSVSYQGDVLSTTHISTDSRSPSVVSLERVSKSKKMEKARRVVREILEKSAPCVSSDAHPKKTEKNSDSGMDFSPEPYYEDCAATMRPKVPPKDREYLGQNPLRKPETPNEKPTRSYMWTNYTPPDLSILASVTSDELVSSVASDNSLLVGDTSYSNFSEHRTMSSSNKRVTPVEISRWSLDSEDLCMSESYRNQRAEFYAVEREATIKAYQDAVKSTIPFPSVKEFNDVDSDIPCDKWTDAVVSPDSCEDYNFQSSPYSGTDILSDSATSSPTEGSISTGSLYSQDVDSPLMASDTFIVEESDIRTPSETHIRRMPLEESSEGLFFNKHSTDRFNVNMNRRAGVIYSDCGLDLRALGLSTSKTASTFSSDEHFYGEGPGGFGSVQSTQCRRVNQENREQGHQPALLPAHINLRKAGNISRKDSSRVPGYVVHPPGSAYTSPEPQAAEKF